MLEEIEYYERMKKIEQEKHKSTYYNGQIKFLEESEKIVQNAEEQKKKVVPFDKRPKKERLAVKPNKDAEKQLIRVKEKFDIFNDTKESRIEQRNPLTEEENNINNNFFLKKQRERFMREEVSGED